MEKLYRDDDDMVYDLAHHRYVITEKYENGNKTASPGESRGGWGRNVAVAGENILPTNRIQKIPASMQGESVERENSCGKRIPLL